MRGGDGSSAAATGWMGKGGKDGSKSAAMGGGSVIWRVSEDHNNSMLLDSVFFRHVLAKTHVAHHLELYISRDGNYWYFLLECLHLEINKLILFLDFFCDYQLVENEVDVVFYKNTKAAVTVTWDLIQTGKTKKLHYEIIFI
ncbi:hypothetical protein VP01_154g1 [Puccinia sorghi]|uniref:Uncharacterized protein n=1 Tax=Puccinia sorghi TaxID=27349 RepID=A0A0L6VI78_9BASI|nr:hypothetical protein VP01_154g1 [Puccinia sorghi]